MKKTFITFIALLAWAMPNASFAQDDYTSEEYESMDTTTVSSLDDIIKNQTGLVQKKNIDAHYASVWKRNTFFNISLNTTTYSSKELPTTSEKGSVYEMEFDNKFGIGLQWGHTYNFHKKAIGEVLFIGLDYTWLDLNVNQFTKEKERPAAYDRGSGTPLNMPWFNEKWTADYGMSLGPVLTLYPFTPIHKSGTDNIRMQIYFHVGFSLGLTFISDVESPTNSWSNDTKESTELAWGYGFNTSFGFNVTWKFIGVGYEARRCNSFDNRYFNKDFDTSKLKFKQTTNRVYLQFRF